jgi:hypothetical protein
LRHLRHGERTGFAVLRRVRRKAGAGEPPRADGENPRRRELPVTAATTRVDATARQLRHWARIDSTAKPCTCASVDTAAEQLPGGTWLDPTAKQLCATRIDPAAKQLRATRLDSAVEQP